MTITEQVPLAELTTLNVGGTARYVLKVTSEAELMTALAWIRERRLPFVVLGEGSNILPPDEGYEGAIILMRMEGVTYTDEDSDGAVRVTSAAGESWDALVRACALRGLWGIENLAGIPGTVGAAPVQNIGAYGAEVRQVIERVRAYDVRQDTVREFTNAECGFLYRDSRFKHEPNLIILDVTYRLVRNGQPHVEYADLIRAREEGADLSSPEAIGNVVRSVRSRKFPDLAVYGTAGSFFKNPIISNETYQALNHQYEAQAAPYGGIPTYPLPGQVKIPLAFILDKLLDMKGYRLGHAFLFGNQPLVLVADHGAHARDIDALAKEIEARVLHATGITIEREVRDLISHQFEN
jgi:UDP-N-acetylmuramate dehydrogenase